MKPAIAAFLLLLVPAAASAADLASTPLAPAAPAALPFSWTGFYLGVDGGYGSKKFGNTATLTGNELVNGPSIPFSEDLGAFDTTARGFFGGGLIGYNYQVGRNIIVGVEADLQYSGIRTDEQNRTPDLFPIVTRTELPWFGTARLRAGYAFDRVLIYGTAGLAYGQIKENASAAFPEAPDTSTSSSAARFGWTVGAGLGYAIDEHWSIKAEYLYADFGKTNAFGMPLTLIGSTGDKINVKPDVSMHLSRVGLSYRF